MALSLSPETLIEASVALDEAMRDSGEDVRRLQVAADIIRRYLRSRVAALLVKSPDASDHVLAVCSGADASLAAHLRERCARNRGKPCFLSFSQHDTPIEVSQLSATGWDLLAPEVARNYGIEAALVCPLVIDGQIGGLLCHFADSPAPFDSAVHQMASFLAVRIQTWIAQNRRLRHAARYQQLNRIMLDLIAERDTDSLLKRMLEEGLRLVNAQRGWISRLDFGTGDLGIVHACGNPQHRQPLRPGRGITWRALKTEQPILAHDVTTPEWRDIYEPYWPDSRSELAVPLLIEAAEVRVRCELSTGSKLIGVLNAESPLVGAFTEMDLELLHSLALHAAALIDGLELDRRLAELTKAQQEMAGTRGWDKILDLMGTTITGAIGFDYVNISLVTPDTKRIRTERILGMADDQANEFKRMADHPLDALRLDIQASLIREPHIEVPDPDDPRFDPEIFKRFRHDQLTRVFVPMAISKGTAIGTVEAGYNRQYRPHIYEQDVRLLEGFVGYAVRALEQRQQGQIQKISHELSAPLSGIRSNASFLQRRLERLEPEIVQRKLGDIAVDAEILFLAVNALEYLLSGRVGADLGTAAGAPPVEPVLVFRDVIFKTVRQLRPLVMSAGLDPERIVYDGAEFMRIPPLYVDRAKFNQVIFNLLLNAIKYADADPATFKIEIRPDAQQAYIIKVRDWGIGIRPDLADQVFNEGFRTPEAIARNVSGSGLGLTISRQVMRQMDGDLILANNAQPTEFHVILPRKMRAAPKRTTPIVGVERPVEK